MTISKETRQKLYERANGQCECTMKECSHHTERCSHKLGPEWDAHHKVTDGPDDLGNLIAMCATCHKNTRTWGKR